MKKNLLPLSAMMALGLLLGATACNGGDKNDKKADKSVATASKNTDAGKLPNYRYVDIDTVLAQYNLSKDYSEKMLQMQNSLESTLRSKETSLQSMAGKMQQKYQNNGYSSQAEFENDQKSLANAQANAQKEAGSLQANYEKQAMQMQKDVRDSIIAYIKVYNKDFGYDAIFMKDAALYINPDLDVTADIVKGLNERYNKVKK